MASSCHWCNFFIASLLGGGLLRIVLDRSYNCYNCLVSGIIVGMLLLCPELMIASYAAMHCRCGFIGVERERLNCV